MRSTKYKNAFTLVEAIISMALIVLVGAIVISFIMFMNSYTAKNEAISNRTRELASLRQEIDKWFSAMDDESNKTFLFNLSPTPPTNYIVMHAENSYISISDDGYTYYFYYNSTTLKTLEFDNAYTLEFAEGSYLSDDESEPAERFTINMPVTGTYYICGVYYE